MGNLLSSPITEKETHRGETDDGLEYAVSSMQGWRISMEDAHIMQPTLYALDPSKSSTTITNENTNQSPVDPSSTIVPSSSPSNTNTHPIASTDSTDTNKSKYDSINECSEDTPYKKAKMNDASDISSSSMTTSAVSVSSTIPPTEDSVSSAATTSSAISKTPISIDTSSSVTSSSVSLDKDTVTTTSTSAATINSTTTTSSTSTAVQTSTKIPLPHHSLYAVFDGHGGSYAAEYAGLHFCRVLFRQAAFLEYAKYYQDQAQREERQRQQQQPQQDVNTLSPREQAQLHREGLESLERALKSAFLELDKEIFINVTEYANQVYNGTSSANTTNTTNDESNDESKDEKTLTPNEDEDSGTTAIVVVVTPQWIICANAGDSRAIYSKAQSMIPLSYDHKPDDEAEERRIQEAGGFVRAGRVEGDLAVSRGLGDFRFKEADSVLASTTASTSMRATSPTRHGDRITMYGRHGSMALAPEDQKVSSVPDIIVQNRNREEDEFIILACDGIWDVQTNQECAAMVSEIFEEGESDVGLLCEEILDTCLIKKSKDNMTAMVIKMAAQTVGEGGGVMERRRLREEELQANEEEEPDSLYT